LIGAILFLVAPALAAAVEPTTPLAGYGRQAWALENGLPQNSIHALLQTRDGFIWLATEDGLVRFDGTGFAVFDRNSKPALPSGDIRCLLQSRDGALWIGTSEGLVRWSHGTSTVYTAREGLPGSGILALAQDEDGSLWVQTEQGIAKSAVRGFVARIAVAQGAPMLVISSDGRADLRVSEKEREDALSSAAWNESVAASEIPRGQIAFLAALSSGQTVVASESRLVVVRSGRAAARLQAGKQIPGSRIQALLADREGSLWIATNGGLTRFAEGHLQGFPVTDPLASLSVLTLMEDREGNLWVGTETAGLQVLRDQRFLVIGERDGLSSSRTTAVVEDGSGTLWVGTAGAGLNALPRIAVEAAEHPAGPHLPVRTYSSAKGLASDVILSLAAAPGGELWVGTPDGLNRIRGNHIDLFTSADGLPDDFIRSLLVDRDGSLWIGTRRGLAHWQIGSARTPKSIYTEADGLAGNLIGAMARDTRGDLWVATLTGLSRLHQGRISNYTTLQGLPSNVVSDLLPRADGTMLVGTEDRGWTLWDGQRFLLPDENGVAHTAIHALLDDGRGHLWFATDQGIARCDWKGVSENGSGAICTDWLEFGIADGLPTRKTATNSHPSGWRSQDGDLWFSTPRGLVRIDPAHFPVNRVPPPVVVERFAVDDVGQPLQGTAQPSPGASLKIAAGHVHFEFEYAGLSFIAPPKVRYRYKLEGFDKNWTDAGTRRTAYYTNIPPGHYIFRVQAANNDGVWNTAGAAFGFELQPHFYQRLWFYALLLATMIALVAWLLRRRLQVAEHEFRAVLGERSRIAREIHDTLAQGYVGISVQLELLAQLLRGNKVEEASRTLDRTREYVREGLADARQSIWALRTQDASEVTLPVRLRRIVEEARDGGLESRFSVFGAFHPLPAETEREVLRVAQEAIHNVKKHSGARQLLVQLEYEPDRIVLEVQDDGRGVAMEQNAESLLGRYGLTGMRERAEAIHGTLEVTGAPGEGTKVRLCAPMPREVREQTGERP
jgi:ligand-binding sensor domain-containing protein/signal transduction histidine kinase